MKSAAAGAPVSDREFDELMARFAPFEDRPHIAVAVSGGSDSLALTALFGSWLRRRDGRLTALTVDHGLRPGSAQDGRWVGARLRQQGIRHHTLTWRAAKPAANLQAQARAARYALLSDWCRRRGVLHLALAHHLDDQAETLLLRLGRGSGLHGLSGMAALTHARDLRVIRPLLTCSRARLTATLVAQGSDWLEDPSNRDPAFARVRIRRILPDLAREGFTADRLGTTVAHLARARAAIDGAVARLLAASVTVHPLGFAWLDWRVVVPAPEEIRLRALSALLTTLAGERYAPRFDRLTRLDGRLKRGLTKAATLGGCLISPRKDRITITREPQRCPIQPVMRGRTCWDGRFDLDLAGKAFESANAPTLGPLGEAGMAQIRADRSKVGTDSPHSGYPAPALRSLPAIWQGNQLLAAPNLGFWRDPILQNAVRSCRFAPKNPLTPTWFTVA